MKEVQESALCPRCEERRQAEQRRKAADAAVAPHVRKVMDEFRGAQPVVIMDLNMSFNSMVWFMVKWAIASIPALIILFIIGVMLVAMFGGFLGALSR
ncbi:hypothetical protein [Pseudomonas sp. SO81]|uniref:hypothetical protein n=1 Tax=Pseudomonas sp. SO81 TaxID=2983246 RepID=UPI0025A45411|nr:hypothetical protein [Pseudomonas sp. SO81]WJN60935.1 hypothetical protein OH686_19495 [Pseudomonas sp. SO81]